MLDSAAACNDARVCVPPARLPRVEETCAVVAVRARASIHREREASRCQPARRHKRAPAAHPARPCHLWRARDGTRRLDLAARDYPAGRGFSAACGGRRAAPCCLTRARALSPCSPYYWLAWLGLVCACSLLPCVGPCPLPLLAPENDHHCLQLLVYLCAYMYVDDGAERSSVAR